MNLCLVRHSLLRLPALALAAGLLLAGCGTKGALTLPPRDTAGQKPPALQSPPAAKTDPVAPADNSSPPAPKPQ